MGTLNAEQCRNLQAHGVLLQEGPDPAGSMLYQGQAFSSRDTFTFPPARDGDTFENGSVRPFRERNEEPDAEGGTLGENWRD